LRFKKCHPELVEETCPELVEETCPELVEGTCPELVEGCGLKDVVSSLLNFDFPIYHFAV
jgi:hypothetical protein